MQIQTDWLSAPRSIKGQDQIGSQTPCELTYTQLLPGITNVTDRARYFSFYTWLTWSFDRRYPLRGRAEYVEYCRRADCLYTLIAAHEAKVADHTRQAESMVGRLQLLPALDRLTDGEPLQLSAYATQQEDGHRYFKNPMGGLGQYYAGPLAELRLCARKAGGPWIYYTRGCGEEIAKAVEAALPAAAFWRAVEGDQITLETLTTLRDFCPYRLLVGTDEHQQLIDIFFARPAYVTRIEGKSGEGIERRRTLVLILHLVRALSQAGDTSISEWTFRPAVYSGTLPAGNPWLVPDSLVETRMLWSIYERNDMFSTACQTIFAASLTRLHEEAKNGRYYASVESFASHYAESDELGTALAALGGPMFGDLIQQTQNAGPSVGDWEDPRHEFSLEMRIHDDWNEEGSSNAVHIADAIQLLSLLAAREDSFPAGYGNLLFQSSDLKTYPINLVSFRERISRWRTMNLPNVVREVIAWCLNTHLTVALRKLWQTGTSSFHLRPAEIGLQVVEDIPRPTRTLPRLRQALRILEDLGALEETEAGQAQLTLTPLGSSLLEESIA